MAINALRLFLAYAIQTIPCCYLILMPYKAIHQVNRKTISRAVFLVAISAIVFTILGMILYSYTSDNSMVNYLFIVIVIITFAIIDSFINRPFYEKVFFILLVIHYALIVSTISNYIRHAWIVNTSAVEDRFINGINDLWIISLITVLVFPLVSKFIKIVMLRLSTFTVTSDTWKKLCLLPLILMVISLLSFMMARTLEFNGTTLSIFILIFISILSTYYLSFNLLQQYRKNIILESEAQILDLQLHLHNQGYNQLVEKMDQFRKIKHDFIHHMRAIDALAQNQDYKKINAYIQEYMQNQYFLDNIRYCENTEIDLLMRYYAGMAKAEKIPIDIKLDIRNDIKVSVADISIILGNCIENAIQASKLIDEEKRMIYVRGRQDNHSLVFSIDNTFDGTIIEESGKLVSTKHVQDAIGVSSVQAILKKYNGVLKYEYDKHKFYVSIFLSQ